MEFDCEIGVQDIQDLAGADAVAAFFARLGYNTDVRMEQSPGNLGITADGTLRPIRRIELIADQKDLLQVYLFELTSVTVTHTRALARTFRNLRGYYLLVLTSDYERLDFVLVERCPPRTSASARTIGQPQAGVRPRTLTVERRKPTSVHLRILRRFTYTESDDVGQYDKLLSAYAIADWSEEFFNNRALFSDYFLMERLREQPQWREDPKPAYRALRDIYQGESRLRDQLIEPTLSALGFAARTEKRATGDGTAPYYRLVSPERQNGTLAVCLAYPWGRSLDGKDDQRDKETPEENPGAVVVSLLERGQAPWAIVTNGKIWRLYSQRTHSRATNYYEIDLEEVLAQGGPHAADPAEAFRYFWLLFRRQAFEPVTVTVEGQERTQSFLDQLLTDSEEYAKKLGERLKERVFEDIFPHLAEGFITHIRQRDGLTADLSQETLDVIFEGTLTLLYRLLFLLFAEARDLLPTREVRGYFEASVTKLKREIAEAAGPIADEVEGNLKKHYHDDRCTLYDRLTRLFQIVDQGESALNVPVYNGGLFITDPAEDDETAEARNARFLASHKVPDLCLACAVNHLARDIDPKRQDLVFIDFKSLGVRQLGSIYEGLLEFKLRIAGQKLGVRKEKNREIYVPFGELDEREKARVERTEKVVRKGHAYLENDKRERKATGSYYTPDHIVKYIVEHAVGPVLQEKFEALRPKFRQAQQERRAFFERQEAFRKQRMKPEPDSKADLIGRDLVDQLFNIKVLDPAMGSGHFLVEAVDFITDKLLDFLNAFPWNPVTARLAETRRTILAAMEDQGITIDPGRLTDVNLLKRHVLKRCIYGVDLNPMAVELAKVSLWLDCFTLGAPLSFLDHHLRCGNSLIGVTVKEVQEALEGKPGEARQLDLFGSRFAGLLLATNLMRHVGELSDVTGAQVQESRREYRKASDALAPFKRILDVYTSQWFGNTPEKVGRGKTAEIKNPALIFLTSEESKKWIDAPKATDRLSDFGRKVAQMTAAAADEKCFFHWELEFPEVFYGPRPGTTQAIERLKGAGFDAVIGNPPYDVLAEKELVRDISQELGFFESQHVYEPAIRGKNNFYKLFICRAAANMNSNGAFSFVVPMALLGDDQSSGVRRMLLTERQFTRIESFPQKDDPTKRVFPEAKLSITVFAVRAKPTGDHFVLRTHPGRFILDTSPSLRVTPQEIPAFDPTNATIPSCTQRDWEIAVRIISHKQMRRIGDYCRAYQGEVNETTDGKKGFVSENPKDGPQILRGSAICLYVLREPSQGEAIYLKKQKYLRGKPDSAKAMHHEQNRVGWQESSPQNNFRRIIAARVPVGQFCNHKINYIPESDSQQPLDFTLSVLNSRLSDWFFRLGSTNAAVSHYQIYNLPAPSIAKQPEEIGRGLLRSPVKWSDLMHTLCAACVEPGVMPQPVADALSELSRRIQEIEAKRTLKSRSERSQLAPESQPIQDTIDGILFHCYGLSDDDARYIEKRLEEML